MLELQIISAPKALMPRRNRAAMGLLFQALKERSRLVYRAVALIVMLDVEHVHSLRDPRHLIQVTEVVNKFG